VPPVSGRLTTFLRGVVIRGYSVGLRIDVKLHVICLAGIDNVNRASDNVAFDGLNAFQHGSNYNEWSEASGVITTFSILGGAADCPIYPGLSTIGD